MGSFYVVREKPLLSRFASRGNVIPQKNEKGLVWTTEIFWSRDLFDSQHAAAFREPAESFENKRERARKIQRSNLRSTLAIPLTDGALSGKCSLTWVQITNNHYRKRLSRSAGQLRISPTFPSTNRANLYRRFLEDHKQLMGIGEISRTMRDIDDNAHLFIEVIKRTGTEVHFTRRTSILNILYISRGDEILVDPAQT